MRNHQCSCGCGEPYRNSPSAFPRSLSIRFLQFPQVFYGFSWFCSVLGTLTYKKPAKNAISSKSEAKLELCKNTQNIGFLGLFTSGTFSTATTGAAPLNPYRTSFPTADSVA